MGTTNDQTALVGNFKQAWGNDVPSLFKFVAPLANRIKFDPPEKEVGGIYHQPVDLQQEHGFTYSAADNTPTLLAAVAGKMGDAQIPGSQIYGRSRVSYEAIMRSQNSSQAVRQATKHVVKRLGMSGTKRLELELLHGRRGLGVMSAISGTSTTRAVTISDATWAAGIWAGMEGATLDIYKTVTTYADTKVNTTGAAGTLYISSVDVANKKLNLTGNSTDLTALDSLVANAYFFLETSSTTASMAGIDAIARNTGSLFNIDASAYALWGGNVYSTTTGTPSMAKFLDALALAQSFGLQGMKATAIVSPKCYNVLNSDEAALVRHDVAKVKGENGFQGLVYNGPTGPLEILSHAFQKDGLAHIIVEEEFHRVGASDLDFVSRGAGGEKLVLEVADSPTSEMRLQSHQGLYCEAPRHSVVLDGITYT